MKTFKAICCLFAGAFFGSGLFLLLVSVFPRLLNYYYNISWYFGIPLLIVSILLYHYTLYRGEDD